MFNVSAILIHDTLQTIYRIDAVTSEALWQCAPLQRDRLLQLIDDVELPAVIDSLLKGSK